MYYGARYYDPALSRFITPDTVYDRGPQGLNRYSYALNNPIRYHDPSGHLSYAEDSDPELWGESGVQGDETWEVDPNYDAGAQTAENAPVEAGEAPPAEVTPDVKEPAPPVEAPNSTPPDSSYTALIFKAEKKPTEHDDPWGHPSEYAKLITQLTLGRTYDSLKVATPERITQISQVNAALQQHKNIVKVFFIGHTSSEVIALGRAAVPAANISHVIRGAHPNKLDWSNLTEDASIVIWGCHAGDGKSSSIAQAVANASGRPVTAPTASLNFSNRPFYTDASSNS